jgi:hypothetical protein
VNYWCSKNSVLLLAIAPVVSLCVFFAGCATPPSVRPPVICPGKRTIAEAIVTLQRHRGNIRPIKAGGDLRLEWYDNEKRPHQESMNINLRFYPPGRVYFRGDTLLGEAIRLGANAEEFWILMKPEEISTYKWGRRTQAEVCLQQHWLNPQNLFEALGMVSIDEGWSLSNQGDFDIFTKTGPAGNRLKRIYVDCCDYAAGRIEYFDGNGKLTISLELDSYTQVGDGATVPTRIGITHYDTNTVVNITLKNVKLFEPSPKQLVGLFSRPEPKGFEYVYRLNDDCEFSEQ